MSFPVIKQLVVNDGEVLGLDQFGQVWARVDQVLFNDEHNLLRYQWVLRRMKFNVQSLREWSAATGEKVE